MDEDDEAEEEALDRMLEYSRTGQGFKAKDKDKGRQAISHMPVTNCGGIGHKANVCPSQAGVYRGRGRGRRGGDRGGRFGGRGQGRHASNAGMAGASQAEGAGTQTAPSQPQGNE